MWAVRARRRLQGAAIRGSFVSTLQSIRAAPCALRSVLWAPTEKQAPSDAAVPSHQLLVRAGFVRKGGHGLFALLPLGRRVVAKLEALIDDEMCKIGGNRVDLTVLTPNELWKQSGRWQSRGPELMTLEDRREDLLILGPTHEESITSLVAAHYNAAGTADSSLRLYQIGRKFRDEIRPRFGLLRAREFVMKDMYSFDTSYEKALQTYEDVTAAYNEILISRLKLPVKRVEADSGNIGGNLSHEFHVLADVGEDAILSCSSSECDYAANVEKAEGNLPVSSEELSDEVSAELNGVIARLQDQARTGEGQVWETVMELQQVAVSQGFSVKFVSSVPRMALCFARHDREVNELTAKPFIGGDEGELHLLLDDSLKQSNNASVEALCAAAETLSKYQKHTHLAWGHFRLAQAGDCCPRCNSGGAAVLEDKRGIEVGHVFYLGQKYSKPFGATYTDAKNNKVSLEMGCYGLGVSRLVAAAVEASHDDHGIAWPMEIAPYKVLVMSIGGKKQDDPVSQAAWYVAGKLASGDVAGLVRDDVLLDDRWRESPGSKLAESELIGYPYRVVVGKRFTKEGLVEVQTRATMEKTFLTPDELPTFFASLVEADKF
ncbi:prolyl-tRNA synthetase, putative [Phytophthora infestans T30-4]|uniref:proline--tRNA ligase n=1 Tax=Phytophthora infestans (strain T30-4) TaxID=403677 RepID=D0MZY3_PHYIT|nr:prolyl-tRNA synthetase, putative [Phytophthora infestans T30-4]EEY65796.1 prolyl-tRNA synthetase, putative [Phytophthora infestans T30-4]|eukprot:XP_002906395.1 prolyl-tRNA synthetase, putative [Phytophthora infestans T30-4]